MAEAVPVARPCWPSFLCAPHPPLRDWHCLHGAALAASIASPWCGRLGAAPADSGAYDADQGTPPADTMGAAEAAAQTKTSKSAKPPAGKPGDIDYSDLETIDPGNRDCFRNNYDEYTECETCVDKAKCATPWPTYPDVPNDTGKTAKPSKTSKPAPSTSTGSGPARVTSPPTPPAGAGGGDKIKDAQARLQAEIAKRKGNG